MTAHLRCAMAARERGERAAELDHFEQAATLTLHIVERANLAPAAEPIPSPRLTRFEALGHGLRLLPVGRDMEVERSRRFDGDRIRAAPRDLGHFGELDTHPFELIQEVAGGLLVEADPIVAEVRAGVETKRRGE